MSHLFNTGSYIQFSLNNLNGMKRQLGNKLQRAAETINDDLHPNTYQEDIVIDNSSFAFSYEGQITNFPAQLLDVACLQNILNPATIQENLNEEEMKEVLQLLPNKNKADLNFLFEKKQLNGCTPFENFERKLKKGYYTTLREREQAIVEKLNEQKMKQIYTDLLNTIKERREEENQQKVKRFSFKDDEDSIQSFENLDSRIQPSDNSDATESQVEENHEDFDDYQNEVFYRYDYTKLKMQQQLLIIGEDKGDRKMAALKNMVTVKPRNSQWVQNFRRQQFQRYSNPTKPWIYVCEDGRKVTVAPVAKKMSVLSGKPRYHPMLKNQRPACVTILTLARDAASRLPNGVGTRADICELVKESQYITEGLSEERLSSTISGALDRLHYMTDACVKYDSEKKLWIYLHIDRNQEHPGWGQDGEEYIEKNSGKKKKFTY